MASTNCTEEKVPLNHISLDHILFNIDVITSIGKFRIKDAKVIKSIKSNINNRTITEEKSLIEFVVILDRYDAHVFNKIIDASDMDVMEYTDVLEKAFLYFEDYELSRLGQNFIDKYINNYVAPNNIWRNLTSKPDYNLCLFKKRTLPYFNVDSKDWVKANTTSFDYPTAIRPATNDIDMTENKDSDFANEKKMAIKNNNFLEWGVLKYANYPDLNPYVKLITTWYKLSLTKQATRLFCKLMLNPNDCHIIKYPQLWELFKPEMEKSAPLTELIKYTYYYAMYILRHEETVMFSQVEMNSRVLFSLKEAASLPTFNSCHMERDPYILQLTNKTRMSQTIPFYIRGNRKINDEKTFTRRFNLATAGAFKGIDMEELSAAVTGSILVPCVHVSPLESGFDCMWDRSRKGINVPYEYMTDNPETKEDILFLNYLEYYYPGYCSLTDEDYKTQVLCYVEQQDEDEPITYDSDDDTDEKKHTAIVNNVVIQTKINNVVMKKANMNEHKHVKKVAYNQLADIDVSITTRSNKVFTERAISLYKQIKANCEHRGDVYIKEIKTLSMSIKYKIFGSGLSRPIDVFRVPYSPEKMVKKFHMHNVKMFYNNKVTLFRSCIASLISGVNESYKWFSCNKLPIDVILKYAQRGISVILNKKERDASSKYLLTDPRWGAALQKMQINTTDIYATVNKHHPFFKPDMYKYGIRLGLRTFERECSLVHTPLVVEHSRELYDYGEIRIKDNDKQYPPNYHLINDVLNYIDRTTIE